MEENIFETEVEVSQEYNNKKIVFDPDSSPKAWEYYNNLYKGRINFDKNHLCLKGTKNNSRLVLREYEIVGKKIDDKFKPELGGDCFFNFNEDKIVKFKELISKKEDDDKLQECKKKHHTVLNMNLMPVTGGLNNAKQSVYFKNRKDYIFAGVGGSGAKYDRGDTFIYLLSEAFAFIKCNKNKSISILEAGKFLSNSIFKWSLQTLNFECLFRFLDYFTDVYEYCDIFYMINESQVKELIESGKKPIETVNDLKPYMETAMGYWNEKKQIL